MQASNASMQNQLSVMQCYICFQNVRKPRMCPSCSKLACQNCLRTWIEQSKPQCPHCRKPLLLSSFADCQRFLNDIKHLISTLDNNEKFKERCQQHRIEMTYYCSTCGEAICSDCGMFGAHKGHAIIRLNVVYQENKNKILGELAKFDNKIELFRKNGQLIKGQLQRLLLQVGQKKNFIEEYFVTLIERLDEEYREKKDKIQAQHDQNQQEIQFLESFRDNICQELECKSEKELITKSEEFISYIQNLCDRRADFKEEEQSFDTIHQLVPKYEKFSYTLAHYSLLSEAILYSNPFPLHGLEWRLKIYPKGNGIAKSTHLSVFLQLSKGYQNQNKYQYKIQLINHITAQQTVIREYSSKFDIGECWGYNQFVPLSQLQNGFLNENSLDFVVSVRNPSYRSLVRDQDKYIEMLQNKLNCVESPPPHRIERMNQLVQEGESLRMELKEFLGREEEEHAEVKVEEDLDRHHPDLLPLHLDQHIE